MRRAFLLSLLGVAACSANLEIPDGVTVTCTTDAGCPNGYRCRGDRCEATSSNGGPDVSIGAVPRSVGTVEIPIRVYDESGDMVSLKAELQTASGTTPITITPDTVPSSTDGTPSTLAWDALSYFGQTSLVDGLVLRITGRDSDATGLTSTSDPFTFGNTPPSLTGLAIDGGAVQGLVVLSFSPTDDTDTVSLSLFEFSTAGDFSDAVSVVPTASNGPGTDFPSGAITGIAADGAPKTVVWDSRKLAPLASEHAAIRLTVSDGLATASATSSLFVLRNQTPPDVQDLTVYTGGDVKTTGAFGVSYRVVDAESDIVDVHVEVSLDGGTTWQTAAEYPSPVSEGRYHLASAPLGLAQSGVGHTFVVDAVATLAGASSSQARIRVSAHDGLAQSAFAEAAIFGTLGVPSEADNHASLLYATIGAVSGTDSADAVAIGDFDHDGNKDLAYAEPDNKKIAIKIGSVGGNFGSSARDQDIAATTHCQLPSRVVVADFNGDHLDDLATLCQESKYLMVAMASTASGLHFDASEIAINTTTHDLAIADMNGDGSPDLVVGAASDTGDAPVLVLINSVLGFGLPHVLTIPDQGAGAEAPDIIGIGDVNGDGAFDIVAGSRSGGTAQTGLITVWTGHTGATFDDPMVYQAPGLETLVVTDSDGDGRSDIAVAYVSFEMSVWLSTAAGFTELPRFPVFNLIAGPDKHPNLIAYDLDHDGLSDLLYGTVALDLFVVRVIYADRYGSPGSFLPDTELVANGAVPMIDLAFGDLTGDGLDDIALATGFASAANLFYGNLESDTIIPSAAGPTQHIRIDTLPGALIDFDADRDGLADFAVKGDVAPTFQTIRTSGMSGFADGHFASDDVALFASAIGQIGACDVNEDGIGDVWISGGPGLSVRVSNAVTADANSVRLATTTPLSNLCVDADGDGHFDILSVLTTNALVVYRGHGDGNFDAAAQLVASVPNGLVPFDYNNDGIWDLLGRSGTSLLVFTGQAGLAYVAGTPLSVAGLVDFVATDVDGDGFDDIVAAQNTGQFVVYRGNGDGSFTAGTPISAQRNIPVFLGDFNGDGAADLVQLNNETMQVQLGSPGRISFDASPASAWTADAAPQADAFLIRDVTGDGLPDTIVAAQTGSATTGAGALLLVTEQRSVPRSSFVFIPTVAPHLGREAVIVGDDVLPAGADRFDAAAQTTLGRRPYSPARSIADRHSASVSFETFHLALRTSRTPGASGLSGLSQAWEYSGDTRLTRVIDVLGNERLRAEPRLGPDDGNGGHTGLSLTATSQRGVIVDLPYLAGHSAPNPSKVRVFARLRDYHRASETPGDPLFGTATATDLPLVNGAFVVWPRDTWVSVAADDDGDLGTGTGARFIVDAVNKRVRVLTDKLGVFQAFTTP